MVFCLSLFLVSLSNSTCFFLESVVVFLLRHRHVQSSRRHCCRPGIARRAGGDHWAAPPRRWKRVLRWNVQQALMRNYSSAQHSVSAWNLLIFFVPVFCENHRSTLGEQPVQSKTTTSQPLGFQALRWGAGTGNLVTVLRHLCFTVCLWERRYSLRQWVLCWDARWLGKFSPQTHSHITMPIANPRKLLWVKLWQGFVALHIWEGFRWARVSWTPPTQKTFPHGTSAFRKAMLSNMESVTLWGGFLCLPHSEGLKCSSKVAPQSLPCRRAKSQAAKTGMSAVRTRFPVPACLGRASLNTVSAPPPPPPKEEKKTSAFRYLKLWNMDSVTFWGGFLFLHQSPNVKHSKMAPNSPPSWHSGSQPPKKRTTKLVKRVWWLHHSKGVRQRWLGPKSEFHPCELAGTWLQENSQ